MQLLPRTLQGCGSRHAGFPVMLEAPWAQGGALPGFIANGHPLSKAHLKVSAMAMASDDVSAMAMASDDVCHDNLREYGNGFSRNSNCLQTQGKYGQQRSQNSATLPTIEDELTLNREIQKFCSLGRPDVAFEFLLHAEKGAHLVSETSYRSLFRACTSYQNVKKLQSHLTRCKLDLSLPLGELLVVALLKCGSIQDGLQVFNTLPQRTVLSWSVVLSHYADCSNGSEALRLYGCMQAEGVEPNEYTYVALFKACGSIPNLQRGIALHTDAKTRGCASSPFVANTLISMYGKCGRIVEAENVFCGMLERDLVSWNAMFSAYVENKEPDKALQLYNKMHIQGVNPNNRTFVFVLQACCLLAEKEDAVPVKNKLVKISALVVLHIVHKDIQLRGLESDIFVGNALMKAYGKCGGIGDSQGVFRALPVRNVVTWNTLLSVFIEHGRGEKALRLYRQMQEEGVTPDERTFVNAVQACSVHSDKEEPFEVGGKAQKLMCLDIGQGLHADAKNMGFGFNLFLGNTLVALYGKCGSLVEAENTLTGLSQRDIVTWTAMLSGYVEQGKAREALLLYRGICEEGIRPDEKTLAMTLQACCILLEKEEAALQDGRSVKEICFHIGQSLYLDGKRLGISSDLFVVSNLVTLYGKCGYVAEAEIIFGSSFRKGTILWNAMLSTYNEQGEEDKALELFRQMRVEMVTPDARTFVIVLQSCCALAEIEAAMATEDSSTSAVLLDISRSLHADIRKRGLVSDPYISSVLVSLYGKCGGISEAENVFGAFRQPDSKLWNAMLLAYLNQDEAEKALQLFAQMLKEGINPDKETCVIALQAACALAEKERASRLNKRLVKVLSLRIGEKLHSVAREKGFDSDTFVAATILNMYSKCRSIMEAEAVFAELPCRSIVSWNTMLAAYIDQGLGEQALVLYEKMKEENVVLDETTLSCLLQASGLFDNKDLCRHTHFMIVSEGCDENLPLASTLIYAYGLCSLVGDAQAVFSKLSAPDAVCWSALIAGYAREKNTRACLEAFDKMQEANIQPNGFTFLSILSTCCHAGLVDKGLSYFESMWRVYGIRPELEHYVTMVELLCRAGDFQRLRDILSNIPERPDPTFSFGILGACQKYRNLEIEELVIARAGHLQSSHPKAYRLLVSMGSREGSLPATDLIMNGELEELDDL